MSAEEDRGALRKAFARAQAVHLGIDIQRYYCAPRFGNPNDKAWYSGISKVVAGISDFTAATRTKLPPVWVNHTTFYVTGPDVQGCGYLQGAAILAHGALSHIFSTKAQRARGAIYGDHAQAQDPVVGKPGRDGFEKTNLDDVLRGMRAETLVLTGLFTDQCVKATALGARARGYEVFVVSDLTQPADYGRDECRAMLRAHGVRVVTAADVKRLAT